MNANQKRKFATNYAQYERLLVLQGYAKATTDNYCRSLRRLAEWADKCPDKRFKKMMLKTRGNKNKKRIRHPFYFSAIHINNPNQSTGWPRTKFDPLANRLNLRRPP